MFNQTAHQYSEYSNQILNWLPMDTEDLYQKNLQDQYDSLKKYNWIDANITYKFNSYGFRSDEFSSEPNIVFLGCSHTVGIGLPLESTWPYLISNQLQLKRFNLGIGASSNDTAFRLALTWISKLKPKLVIFLSTDEYRLELHTENTIADIGPWSNNQGHFYKEWVTNCNNSKLNYLKNKLAVQQICMDNNIKFLEQSFAGIIPMLRMAGVYDFARDLSHRGVESNKIIANYFLSQI